MPKKAYVGIQDEYKLLLQDNLIYNADYDSFESNLALSESLGGWSASGKTLHNLTFKINNVLYEGIAYPDAAKGSWYGICDDFYFYISVSDTVGIENCELFNTANPLSVEVYLGHLISKARKIKTGYVGIPTEISTYEENDVTVGISNSNIADFFDVVNGAYGFKASSTVFSSTNSGVGSSSAISTWIAKQNIKNASFEYTVSSESGFDKFTVVVKGTTIANAISGETTGTWAGSLNKGDTIQLTYSKDGSVNSGNDCGIIRSFNITYPQKTLISTEIKEVAHKVKKAYVSIGGFARPTFNNT